MPKFDPGLALLVFGIASAVLAVVFWPQHGLLARVVRRFGRSDWVLGEDILKAIYHGRAADLAGATRILGVSPAHCERVVRHLADWKLLAVSHTGSLELTEPGRARAVQLVRAHRLWERYLADRTGVAEAEWHDSAERKEHQMSPAEADRLASRMGAPLLDPHGDPIPGPAGDVHPLEGHSLSEAEAGHSYEIVHLEDEPTSTYRRLVQDGFAPGLSLEVVEHPEGRVVVELDGRRIAIEAPDAESVTVRRAEPRVATAHRTLAALEDGLTARVIGLAPTLRGPQRRRLLDLGFVPGTEVTAEMRSAMGEPIAFRVRGALIALRREQAGAIWVEAA